MFKIFLLFLLDRFIGIIAVLIITKDNKDLSFKIPFIILILLCPILGLFLYKTIGCNKKSNTNNNYSISNNNLLKYYPLCEEEYKDILSEISKAKKYIFIEFYTINIGFMWTKMLSILKEKVKQGVEVRIIYDDLGCLFKLPFNYKSYLEQLGIKCVVYNKINFNIFKIFKNRDHRKIIIVDGKIAFTGGFNISDEYINITKPYGHYKDIGISFRGDGVFNYTISFLDTWNYYKKEDRDYSIFKYDFKKKYQNNGIIIPFTDNPNTLKRLTYNTYLNLINRSTKYVYIYTPYLIIDEVFIKALTLAASRGIDIRIIVPGIPDKKLIYKMTKSCFNDLITNGIKIYTYTPGFLHAKAILVDDIYAVIGSCNVDYRSMYLHYENSVYLENINILKDIKNDILDTISISNLCSIDKSNNSLFTIILKFFASFM